MENLGAIPTRSARELYIKDTCLRILKKHGGTKEHDVHLAVFVAQEMGEEYLPKTLPGVPEVITEYRKLSAEDKFIHDKKYPLWRADKIVVDYFVRNNKIEVENDSNKGFLERCQAALGPTDLVMEKGKLANMLARYGSFSQPMEEANWSD